MAAQRSTETTTDAGNAADVTYVVVSVDDEHYALPVSRVQRTLPLPALTRVPATDSAVIGVFQHAGRIITTWDARRWFQAGNDPPAEPWLVIVEHAGHARAVLVDRVVDVLGVPDGRITSVRRVPAGVPTHAILGRLVAPDVASEEASGAERDATAAGLDQEQAERRARRLAAETLAGLGTVYVIDLDALLPAVAT